MFSAVKNECGNFEYAQKIEGAQSRENLLWLVNTHIDINDLIAVALL